MIVFRRSVLVISVVAAMLAGVFVPGAGARQDTSTPQELCAAATVNIPEPATREFGAAEPVLVEGVDYGAVFCTDHGAIYVDLFEDKAPVTVNNFVFLAQQNYFNNITFHRVIPGFMAQGGDPTGTGSGGPGYEFGDETDNGLTFDTYGLLAMANAGPGTNGSQFFITYAPTTWLDGSHTIFGQVRQGMDVAELLTPRDPDQGPTYEGDTLQTVVIVDDPAAVTITPDAPPGIDHLQAMVEATIVGQLNRRFVPDAEASHAYDLDAEAAFWQGAGGGALADYMRAYLSDHGFLGTAAAFLNVAECPEDPASFPFWALNFQVSDFGTADGGQVVVLDEARAAELVETGAFESQKVYDEFEGRLFSRAVPEGEGCSATGQVLRLEAPLGRYVLAVEMSFDSSVLHETSQPTAEQFMGYIMQDLVLQSMSGVFGRGNAALAE